MHRLTGGLVIKKRGAEPIMIANPMEVEEAAASGLTVLTYNDLDWAELIKQAQGDRSKATDRPVGTRLARPGCATRQNRYLRHQRCQCLY